MKYMLKTLGATGREAFGAFAVSLRGYAPISYSTMRGVLST